MLLTTLTAALETAFNAWLKLDGEALPRLQALQGRIIAFHITNPSIQLYFIPTSDGVNVLNQYDCEPDVTLTGSALAFMRLSGAEDSAKAMLENHVQVDGNMGIAEQFSSVINNLDVDWEELLSHAVGDIVAHQAGQLAREGKGWLDDTAQAMRLNTSEYLQEESRLLPAEAEISAHMNKVDTLRSDVDRINARIQRLQKELDTPNNTDGQ
ncbi:MAG: Protein YigP (COG3165) clustered with ubiquinone biosynthetic genes [uncultured Thiotrichaceae bacterium]|uniref:Ubiquinone biosynthesis accessory factor UbiJ n=1 Tax=uncultured Thiotrichaceae bacterium TaxID=298394 RepID=A0A6S6TL63_9GAMM|nr:MAG: Protein YigP (COG3165) clustered with ubiquinone biosynthetic genes [uncultured Thiotrichaceae bacterium]